jgi:excisionase family DNA binding protein
MTDAPEFLRADDIARLTGLSLRTVRRWIADEIVPSVKVRGGDWYRGRGWNKCFRPHQWMD